MSTAGHGPKPMSSPAPSRRRNSFSPHSPQQPALGIPRIAVVLGSGLGDFAGSLQSALIIDYEQIPFFPRSTAIGHAGRLVIGKLGEVTLAVDAGPRPSIRRLYGEADGVSDSRFRTTGQYARWC